MARKGSSIYTSPGKRGPLPSRRPVNLKSADRAREKEFIVLLRQVERFLSSSPEGPLPESSQRRKLRNASRDKRRTSLPN
jgi:hypothetical protein